MRWLGTLQPKLAAGIAAVLAATLSASTAVADNVIKIGAPLALTGALADSGKKQKLGFDLWLERVKKAGGIKVGGQLRLQRAKPSHARLPR